ncbi:MAG: phosphoenolpyruvate--protein phosphotransferase [Treponema sp.]|nr:phosphoenolpyruvate--protein phosphotransferase [Treponema sp.]
MNLFLGISSSTGIGIGKAFVVPESEKRAIPQDRILPGDRKKELEKFESSIATVMTQIAAQMESVSDTSVQSNKVQKEIFETYFLMLNDPEFLKNVRTAFENDDHNIAYILNEKTEESAEMLEASGNEYLAERAQDIRDVFGRVLDDMLNHHPFRIDTVPDGSVIVARTLNPSETLILSKRKIAGIALIEGGISSHVGILARSYGIPTVFDLHKITEEIKQGNTVIVDGNLGEVIDEPDDDTIEEYKKKIEDDKAHLEFLSQFRNKPAQTKDGEKFRVMANIGTVEEAEIAAKEGADGIGLFRTEFLFMKESNDDISVSHKRGSSFSEESQFEAYKHVLEIMQGKPVTIRTLDAGGDKIINSPEIKTHEEKNPLMGQRAIRLSLANPSQLKTQFKALFRAGKFGNLKIMLPLITSVEQIEEAQRIAEKAKEELRDAKIDFAENVPIGIMVETAAAAMISDCLAKRSAFFSIGTNDLTQYTIGVDRENAHVAAIYDEFHLAVLRLIDKTVKEAAAAGIEVSVCGEMAAKSDSAMVLGGMGIRTFSMSPKKITEIKELLSRFTVAELKAISEKNLKNI